MYYPPPLSELQKIRKIQASQLANLHKTALNRSVLPPNQRVDPNGNGRPSLARSLNRHSQIIYSNDF